jgi:Tol biopolymer transport system component
MHPEKTGVEKELKAISSEDRLDSWKEIAAYFRRDVRTVRRWEKLGLPVHRHRLGERAAVYAFRHELDAWWQSDRRQAAEKEAAAAGRFPPRAVWIGALATLGVLAAAWLATTQLVTSSDPPARASRLLSLVNDVTHLSFSPDGENLAFIWAGEKAPSADIYALFSGESAPSRLSARAGEECCPAWSPDGSQIAFIRRAGAETGIYLVPARGGEEKKLFPLRDIRYFDLAWSNDGQFLFFAAPDEVPGPTRILRLRLADLKVTALTSPPKETDNDSRFALSADGRFLAFIRHEWQFSTIYVMPVSGGSTVKVFSEKSWIGRLAWCPEEQCLMFSSDRGGGSRLWRVALSGGEPELWNLAGESAWFPVVAPRGNRLAFVQERWVVNLTQLELDSPRGPVRATTTISPSMHSDVAPQYSPDGKRVVFNSNRSGRMELWAAAVDGSQLVQLTSFRTGNAARPVWSPDGSQILFQWQGALTVISAGGASGSEVQLTNGSHPAWSRDGKWIYFFRLQAGVGGIWKIPAGGGTPISVVQDDAIVGAESKDGKHFYFSRVNRPGIWRMPLAGGEETLVVESLAPHLCGYWALSADGLYWLKETGAGSQELMFYDFKSQKEFPVAPLHGRPAPWESGMAVSPDGRRLILADVLATGGDIILVENFR